MTDRDKIIERIAKAIYFERDGAGARSWINRSKAHKLPYLIDADAALKAIEAAGLAIVPKEPTDAMLTAGINDCRLSIRQDRAGIRQMTTPFEDECASIYRAMLAAGRPE